MLPHLSSDILKIVTKKLGPACLRDPAFLNLVTLRFGGAFAYLLQC